MYSGFSLSSKTNASKFQFDLERTNTFKRAVKCLVGKYIAIYTLCLGLAVSPYIRGVPGGSREAKHDRSSPECCSQ